MKAFRGHFDICTFGFGTKGFRLKVGEEFAPLSKSDAVLYLDSRTLPSYVNVSVGLVEPGRFPPYPSKEEQKIIKVIQIMMVTTTIPWIYIKVHSMTEQILEIARQLVNSAK